MERYLSARNRFFSLVQTPVTLNDQEFAEHLHAVHAVPAGIIGDNPDCADMEVAHNLDHNLGSYSHTHERKT